MNSDPLSLQIFNGLANCLRPENFSFPLRGGYKTLFLLCIKKSKIGGQSIIVDLQPFFSSLKNSQLDVYTSIYMKVPRFETFRNLEIVEKEALYSPIRGYYYFPFHNNFTYSEEQLQALKSLNDYINATQNQAQFTLEDGDLLVANNKRVIHGRLPFEDSGNQRRLLLRYWIG